MRDTRMPFAIPARSIARLPAPPSWPLPASPSGRRPSTRWRRPCRSTGRSSSGIQKSGERSCASRPDTAYKTSKIRRARPPYRPTPGRGARTPRRGNSRTIGVFRRSRAIIDDGILGNTRRIQRPIEPHFGRQVRKRSSADGAPAVEHLSTLGFRFREITQLAFRPYITLIIGSAEKLLYFAGVFHPDLHQPGCAVGVFIQLLGRAGE